MENRTPEICPVCGYEFAEDKPGLDMLNSTTSECAKCHRIIKVSGESQPGKEFERELP